MNNQRRKEISHTVDELSMISDRLFEAKNRIEECLADEENYKDCLQEDSTKFALADEACDNLNQACNNMEDAFRYIEDAISSLLNAAE